MVSTRTGEFEVGDRVVVRIEKEDFTGTITENRSFSDHPYPYVVRLDDDGYMGMWSAEELVLESTSLRAAIKEYVRELQRIHSRGDWDTTDITGHQALEVVISDLTNFLKDNLT